MPLKQQASTAPRAFSPTTVQAAAARLRKSGDSDVADIIAYLQRQLSANGIVCCQGCGCTQGDCAQCVAKTGSPCSWVTRARCSACTPAPHVKLKSTTVKATSTKSKKSA